MLIFNIMATQHFAAFSFSMLEGDLKSQDQSLADEDILLNSLGFLGYFEFAFFLEFDFMKKAP